MTDREKAIAIVRILKEHGHQAVFAGGFVRDMIIGRESNDIDIATSAKPEQVEEIFERTIPVGKAFGVVRVLFDMTEFEVATFRADSKGGDGRRPDSVTFCTIDGDAARRDFTINGLFLDPIDDKVIDFVGGQNDIAKKRICFIGDPIARINEDHLRILRAIRFAAVLGFRIERESYKVIKENASLVSHVSSERVREELVKTLKGGDPRIALTLLSDTGLLDVILPELTLLRGTKQDPIWHPEGDAFEHTIKVLEVLCSSGASIEARLAGLFHDIGKPQTTEVRDGRIVSREHAKVGADITRDVMGRLRFPNKQIDHVAGLVYDHMKPLAIKGMRKAKIKRLFAQDTFADLKELHRADKLGGMGDLSTVELIEQLEEKFSSEPLKPIPLIDGRDLIGIGFKEGREIGSAKRQIYDLQLEGKLTDKAGALEFAKALLDIPVKARLEV